MSPTRFFLRVQAIGQHLVFHYAYDQDTRHSGQRSVSLVMARSILLLLRTEYYTCRLFVACYVYQCLCVPASRSSVQNFSSTVTLFESPAFPRRIAPREFICFSSAQSRPVGSARAESAVILRLTQ
jgi:hypothetical protein